MHVVMQCPTGMAKLAVRGVRVAHHAVARLVGFASDFGANMARFGLDLRRGRSGGALRCGRQRRPGAPQCQRNRALG